MGKGRKGANQMGSDGYLGDLDIGWSDSQFSCTLCGEAIAYKEEVFVLTVVLAQMTERGVLYSPLLFEDGDFLYEPHFLCFNCCEESLEELHDLLTDVPPLEDEYTIIDCSQCKSGVRAGEVIGLITHGELAVSKRSPNGVNGGSTFEVMDDDPRALCISCLNRLSNDVVDELWADRVQQYQECAEGTELRCWRNGCSADACGDCMSCKRVG